MAKDITSKLKSRKYQQTEIPEEVLDAFFQYLETKDVDEKIYYDIDILGKAVPTKKVVTRQHRSLSDSIKLFEKIYPQHFNKSDELKVKELERKTGDDKENSMLEDIKKAFEGGI